MALALLFAGCYRGDFLDQACDRKGTCLTSTSETGTSTGETEASTGDASTGEPAGVDVYRMTQIEVVDPHFFYELGECLDASDVFNNAIANEVAAGTIHVLLILDPADPSLAQVPMRIAEGACVGAGFASCSYKDPTLYVPTIATNVTASTCDVQIPGTVNPIYAEDGTPNIAGPPCFTTQRGAVVLPSLVPTLPPIVLYDAQLAAAYASPERPIDGLVTGVLTGFVPESYALQFMGDLEGLPFTLWEAIAGGGGCIKDPDAPIDDTDPNPDPGSRERGVQVYINFVAERVEWIE
ncbi:MAG: hypothetical protein R3B09_04480 [Nannocystaceae bacterium]